MKVSAVIITLNEEANLSRCLKSLQFCDEIIVVDSHSRDRTCEIARMGGAKVHLAPWQGYVEQRNLAAKLAKNSWVLSIDADEVVSDELKQEIEKELDNPSHQAYSIPRKTIHFGRWIRHGGWYPNRLVRLFDKTRGSWVGNELHERWLTLGSQGELQHDLIHYSFVDLSDQVERNNKYSTLGAVGLQNQGVSPSLFRLITKPISKFFETYFLKLGLLDGYPGFIISVSAAYSVFLKWCKLWELRSVKSSES